MAFGSLYGLRSQQPIADINVIPLVDVMLVLLIIFIVTAPLLTHAVKLDLPKASSRPDSGRAERIELAMQAGGGIFWNGQEVSAEELARRLAMAGRAEPPPRLNLAADQGVPYGRVAQVVSMAARAGVGRVGLVTDPAGAVQGSRIQ